MTISQITKTAGDVASYVKRQFGDESGVQITDSDIFRWISSAQLQLVAKIAPIQAKSTTNIVANTKSYDLSALPIHQIQSIHYDGAFLPPKNFQEAEQSIYVDPPTAETTDIPLFWYSFAGEIFLYPTPNKSITAGLTIYYTKMPTPVVTGTDALSVPDKFFDAIASWVLSKAYELDEEFEQAMNYRQFFDNQVLEQNGEEQTMANALYPTITYLGD